MQDKFRMAGTEGTYDYFVPAVSRRGRVGFRLLEGGRVRIRVEPANERAAKRMKAHFPEHVWKQPGDGSQFRFSTVVTGDAVSVAENAIRALGIFRTRNKSFKNWRVLLGSHTAPTLWAEADPLRK